ncbi:MAG: hypothetical protein JW891_06095 [Candidatus Lokiarchaeota archaeon]|nr:hypothetical protein [Candidatus Lokiarchaeota archaeon]
MKALTIIGAIVSLIFVILGLLHFFNVYSVTYPYWNPFGGEIVMVLVGSIIGLVIAALTLMCAVKPGDPIPFNWIILLIFAILLIIFAHVLGGVLVLIAFLIGLIEDL